MTRHTSHAPEEMLASPPQKKVDANELNPAEFDDGHEGGLNTVAGDKASLNAGTWL